MCGRARNRGNLDGGCTPEIQAQARRQCRRALTLPRGSYPYPWWRRDIVGDEEIGRKRLSWIEAIGFEILYASKLAEQGIVDTKAPGEALCWLGQDQMRRIRQDVRLAAHSHKLIATEQIIHRRRGNCRSRPQGIDRNAVFSELRAHAKRA